MSLMHNAQWRHKFDFLINHQGRQSISSMQAYTGWWHARGMPGTHSWRVAPAIGVGSQIAGQIACSAGPAPEVSPVQGISTLKYSGKYATSGHVVYADILSGAGEAEQEPEAWAVSVGRGVLFFLAHSLAGLILC
jgi:hypothetical protein